MFDIITLIIDLGEFERAAWVVQLALFTEPITKTVMTASVTEDGVYALC